MGVKISSLPVNALPYTGSEKIPLVQSGTTKAGTLSSFNNYLSGAGVLLPTTAFRSTSANFAVKNADNNFTNTQTISVVETTKVKFGSLKVICDQSNANILFGYNVTDTSTGSGNISIGLKANSIGTDNIVIGTQSLSINPLFGISDSENIAIGVDIDTVSSNHNNNILIGANIALNTTGTQSENIIIGRSASCQTNATNNNIIMGSGATTSHNYCLVFGYSASTTIDNQLAFGNINVTNGSLTPDAYTTISIAGVEYHLLLSSPA